MAEKVALITGASSGIGKATAVALAREDIHVTGVARRMERLNALVTEINALPAPHGDFLGIAGDVTEPESIQAAVAETVERFGRLDILVANAGIGHRDTLVEAKWDDLETLLRTNIDGVLHSIRASIPTMRANGGGHIFIISSITGHLVNPNAAAYAASKAFVSSIAHSLRLELQDDHIYVTDVLVGRTDTEFNARRLGKGPIKSQRVPEMPPERVAEAIVRGLRKPSRSITVRWLDRFIIWGSILFPDVLGRLAKHQYQ